MLEKGTNMDISERANDKWSLAFGDMDIVFLLHLTTCNKMGRKTLKFVLIFAFRKEGQGIPFFNFFFSLGRFTFLRLLPMSTSISEHHLLFWYSWTLL